jgi:asparagine synthase (glutamine-hydrolysing)
MASEGAGEFCFPMWRIIFISHPPESFFAFGANLQFSDGVGYSWIDGMKDHASSSISDELFATRATRYTTDTPDTKEAYWIRQIFEQYFPTKAAASTAVRWIPKQEWGVSSDPSGRAVSIHTAAYGEGQAKAKANGQ